ncbi:hypothetical protein SCOCK_540005 [Actinacidiphila cocklensis]|uniref:Uncharacterized protein n=1 Tax=Actinacidiphila cocklensis TaxID=887465 RepID=A0A9W4GW60_9ACTN|nr:hypothetical protein SCOCK_540005 [Actinacidiphila cocklensis]
MSKRVFQLLPGVAVATSPIEVKPVDARYYAPRRTERLTRLPAIWLTYGPVREITMNPVRVHQRQTEFAEHTDGAAATCPHHHAELRIHADDRRMASMTPAARGIASEHTNHQRETPWTGNDTYASPSGIGPFAFPALRFPALGFPEPRSPEPRSPALRVLP